MNQLRNRLCATTAMLLAPPDGASSPGSSGASSPSSSGSPSTPSGGAASSGVTPPGSSVAPGVEPPPGSPGSTVSDSPASDPSMDFMSIFESPGPVFPGSETPAVTPPAATPTAAPPVAPAPEATPAAVQPPAAAPAGPGDGGQQPAGATPSQPSGQSPALDPYDPAGLAIAVQQNEQATVDHVASTLFQLSNEDVQALETDIVGTIPKLMARAFVKTQVNQLMQLARIIPEMVRRSSENLRTHTQNEDAFYTKWPQINRQTHGDLVRRYGITYRSMNPQATKEQMMEDLGPLVMMAAKIPLTAAPATPTAQPHANGAVRPAHQPTPFSPAIPGPAATIQSQELSDVEAMFAPRD